MTTLITAAKETSFLPSLFLFSLVFLLSSSGSFYGTPFRAPFTGASFRARFTGLLLEALFTGLLLMLLVEPRLTFFFYFEWFFNYEPR